MARTHPTRVVTSLTVAVENEYGNYLAGKVMDGGRLANFRHPRAIRIFRCARLRCRAASRSVWMRGALSGADARRTSGSDSPAHGFGVRGAVRVDEAICFHRIWLN